MDDKQIAREVAELNDKILQNWEKTWDFQTQDSDPVRREKSRFVSEIVQKNYAYFEMKARQNREENFEQKDQFIAAIKTAVILEGILVVVAAVLWAMMKWDFAPLVTAAIFISIFQATAFYAGWKKIEVHKKQETWVRHYDAYGMLQNEMLRYYLEAEPYNHADKKENNDAFTENILKAFTSNRKKFVDNMEKKEAGFSELFELMKLRE